EFLDDGIGEDFLGDALSLRLSVFASQAVEINDEEFALADVFDGVVAKSRKGVLNRLALGIEYGALRHDPNVCFHKRNYNRTAYLGRRCYKAVDFFEDSNEKAWAKLASMREESSDSERPMRWALRYSEARSVWNMVGSSVERVTGIPCRRSC